MKKKNKNKNKRKKREARGCRVFPLFIHRNEGFIRLCDEGVFWNSHKHAAPLKKDCFGTAVRGQIRPPTSANVAEMVQIHFHSTELQSLFYYLDLKRHYSTSVNWKIDWLSLRSLSAVNLLHR